MRFLLIAIILFFQSAYSFDPIPIARGAYFKNRSKGFDEASAQYSRGLQHRASGLSKEDAPAIFGGYVALVRAFAERGDSKAASELGLLSQSPNQSRYQELLRTLNASTGCFESYLPGRGRGFAFSMLQMMNHAQNEYYWKYSGSQRQDLKKNPLSVDELNSWPNERIFAGFTGYAEAGLETAVHKIMAGAFGFKRVTSVDEKKMMTRFLVDSAHRTEDIHSLLSNYVVSTATDLRVRKHITICRTILASVYYLIDNNISVWNADAESGIKDLIGREWLDDDGLVERVVFRNPEVLAFLQNYFGDFVREESPAAASSEASSIDLRETGRYRKYLHDPRKFLSDVTRDLSKYGSSLTDDSRKLVDNVLHYLYATQMNGSEAMKAMRVKRVYPLWPERELEDSDVAGESIAIYESQNFEINRDEIKDVLQKEMPEFDSRVWLSELVDAREVLKPNKYNRKKVADRTLALWKRTYDMMVSVYEFAQQQRLEKGFFYNAFPKQKHCVGSLATEPQAWMQRQKEIWQEKQAALARGAVINDAEISRLQLSRVIEELINAENVFIGSVFEKLVLYWMAPRFLQWTKAKGREVTLDQLELNTENLLITYEDNFVDLASQFSGEISERIKEQIKIRLANFYNASDRGISHGLRAVAVAEGAAASTTMKGKYTYATIDNDLEIICMIDGSKRKIDPSDITEVEIQKNLNEDLGFLIHEPSLEEYLKLRYLQYFREDTGVK